MNQPGRDRERLLAACFLAEHRAEQSSGLDSTERPFGESAFDQVCDVLRDDPGAAWRLVQELILQAESAAELCYVAAGPLEDLLCLHGEATLAHLPDLLASDQRFRDALAAVWTQRMPERVRAIVESLQARYDERST